MSTTFDFESFNTPFIGPKLKSNPKINDNLISVGGHHCLPFCQTCEINRLKKQVNNLTIENNFLKGNSNINIDSRDIYNAKNNIKRINEPINRPINLLVSSKTNKTNQWFFTVTFDPDKFGNGNDNLDEEDYILVILHKMILERENFYIHGLYMCFEKTKAGVIHAHGIITMYSSYYIAVRRYLKKSFTNNPRNDKAIQLDPLRPKGLDYINKIEDYKKWYVWNKKTVFIYDEEKIDHYDGPVNLDWLADRNEFIEKQFNEMV